MPTTLSVDLRQRVASAVSAGVTCRQAAERFGVSRASASRWSQQKQRVGHVAPKPLGGDQRSRRIEAHADLILQTYQGSPADLPARVAPGASGARGRSQHQQPVALLRPAPDHAEKGALHAAEGPVAKFFGTWFVRKLRSPDPILAQPEVEVDRLRTQPATKSYALPRLRAARPVA